MPKFSYAKGRVNESLQFITEEMREFKEEYSSKLWQDYQNDKKLQKLMDRTVENILTALIEMSGTLLTEEEVAVESYSDALKKVASLLRFNEEEQEELAKLAIARNRLAHRYLNFRWQAIKMYVEKQNLIQRLLTAVLEKEKGL
ncbi:MAG: HepT-like ribonuclease domain-containing protein [Candidatus Edwardsbacteria bacterium]